MGKIRVDVEGFDLYSEWRVVTGSNGVATITEGPSTATMTVTFTYNITDGSKVKSAKVHSTWGSPLSGYAVRTVNGVTPNDSNGWMVDVDVDPEKTSIEVVFAFKANGDTSTTGVRGASASVDNVYLLIETAGGCIYHVEEGKLVPYNIYHAENNGLVLYTLYGAPGDYEPETYSLLTSSREQVYTSVGHLFKVLGGKRLNG